MGAICDRDCFNCRYDDCICDEMNAVDYREARSIDSYARPRSRKQEAIAAKQREYYEANKEAIAAKQREYREANKEAIAAQQREYYEANKEVHSVSGAELRRARKLLGWTQKELAYRLGMSQPEASLWETGRVPIPYEKVSSVIPGLFKADIKQEGVEV